MTTYNGWTNYETWVVALWINNEQWSQETVLELVRAEIENGAENPDDAVYEVAETLKQWVDDTYFTNLETDEPIVQGLAQDLLRAAVSEVDWFEIARSFIADLAEYSA